MFCLYVSELRNLLGNLTIEYINKALNEKKERS
mgnify:CR=1 FL=1